MPSVSTTERFSLYASTIAFQWAMVALVAWRAWAHRFTATELGLVIDGRSGVLFGGIVGGGVLAALQWLNLRRMGRLPAASRGLLQSLAARIFPQSRVEMLPFFALALTAGICEEFLYRGFAMGAFLRAGLPIWEVVLISSFLFGLAHLYQGYGGAAGATLLGALFGAARMSYHSLVPVIIWHSAVDLIAGAAGSRYLRRPQDAGTKSQNGVDIIK
jgi:membrane protease YdiL (CAAX protease family)